LQVWKGTPLVIMEDAGQLRLFRELSEFWFQRAASKVDGHSVELCGRCFRGHRENPVAACGLGHHVSCELLIAGDPGGV
jgi:hypothetical protein